ncbi:MAG: hypothetical protein ACK55I_46375, partial [bacterium]
DPVIYHLGEKVAEQRARRHQPGIAFDLGGVGQIEMNAVSIPERRVVEKELDVVRRVVRLGQARADLERGKFGKRSHRSNRVVFSVSTGVPSSRVISSTTS